MSPKQLSVVPWLGLVMALSPVALAAGPTAGVLNAIDGDVRIDGAPALPMSAGKLVAAPGQVIETRDGMVELLLTPGSFLRLGPGSKLRLTAADAQSARAVLSKGEALLETVDLRRPGAIRIEENGANVAIGKPGLYDFNRKRNDVAVYAGSARLDKNGDDVTLERGQGAKTRNLREFQAAPDRTGSLYAWSYLRSQQLSRESAASAESYPTSRDWSGPAWYWDPWAASYTFLSASGHINGPFGWPFYAPGHSHNYIPEHRGGDAYLYGPPVPAPVDRGIMPSVPATPPPAATVPLTAPGVPTFPKNH